MNTLYYSAPVETRSGYGAHSRDILRSLIKMNKYKITVIPTRWGNTPLTALDQETDNDIISLFPQNGQRLKQPDIWVQVTVPNEFVRNGKYMNIGITAGIETDRCSAEWLEGLNRMDKVIVPSEFSKQVLANTYYNIDQNGQIVGQLKCEREIDVVFEGVDTKLYQQTKYIPSPIRDIMGQIKENFAFLFVGHWLNGELGADRKNVANMIRLFMSTFQGAKNAPALVLKTGALFSKMEEYELRAKIEAIRNHVIESSPKKESVPNVYVVYGDLTDKQMNALYNHEKIKAMICLTRGEGYGRPIAEFATTGKPIICSDWSGPKDFLNSDCAVMVPGQLTKIHPSAVWDKVLIADSQWFEPNYNIASMEMSKMFNFPAKFEQTYGSKGRIARDKIISEFSLDRMDEKIKELFLEYTSNVPEEVEFKLPKLKKINMPSFDIDKLIKEETDENES